MKLPLPRERLLHPATALFPPFFLHHGGVRQSADPAPGIVEAHAAEAVFVTADDPEAALARVVPRSICENSEHPFPGTGVMNINVEIPLAALTAVTGVSAAG